MKYAPIRTHILDAEYAYDETQCNDAIEDGDTLVAGGVVGFLAGAWPIAVTVEAGQFHQTIEGSDPEGLYAMAGYTGMKPCAIATAAQYAHDNGFSLHPDYAHLVE